MKRFLCLLLALLLLTGCRQQPSISDLTMPSVSTPSETEPVQNDSPSLLEQGEVWDDSGTLLEIPLNIPNLWQYNHITGYRGNILLWCNDYHREGRHILNMCLVSAQTGEILSEAKVEGTSSLTPQVAQDAIYLCDNLGGRVVKLDASLQTGQDWQVPSNDGMWYMGQGDTLYQIIDNASVTAVELQTEQSRSIIENAQDITVSEITDSNLALGYRDSDTGEQIYAALDLTDGTLRAQPFDGDFSEAHLAGQTWLCCTGYSSDVYYLGSDDAPMRVNPEDSSLMLLGDGHILETTYSGLTLRLYDLDGGFLSECRVSDIDEYYISQNMIWNQDLGGYFFLLEGYDSSRRLMFWDVSKGTDGEALTLEVIPPPSEQMQALQQRCDTLQQQYGVNILVGNQCQTEFSDFTAELTEDYEAVSLALDHLQEALDCYPEGFFRQLMFYEVQGVQLHMVGPLTPSSDSDRAGGSYNAFTYPGESQFVVVVDVFSCNTDTYFHEFSHNIDLFLEYDAMQRQKAPYSEDQWMALNPEGFAYAYDYAAEFEPLSDDYYDYFIDSYSTVSPTEDRARVMEYAMSDYGSWSFDEHPPLREKLEYYSQCIRDAFDTTGWPEMTVWEQYLQEN